MRLEEVEHLAVTLAEIGRRPVELEGGPALDQRTDPEPHHVLDPQRPRRLLVELGAVELALRPEVRVRARPIRLDQEILVPPSPVRFPNLRGDRPEWLSDPDHVANFLAVGALVVRDDVTGHQPT